jgi:hypothetical protein
MCFETFFDHVSPFLGFDFFSLGCHGLAAFRQKAILFLCSLSGLIGYVACQNSKAMPVISPRQYFCGPSGNSHSTSPAIGIFIPS